MQRRDVFKFGALAAAATTATVELEAQTAAKTTTAGIAAAWKPESMDAHQNDTLATVADLIIPDTDTPGARAANVHRHIDKLLAVGDDEQRHRFIGALNWLDGYAIEKHDRPFVKCSKEQQVALLTAMDEGNEDGMPQAGQMVFRGIKGMVSRVYYATEIGFRELNKGGRVPKTFGCQA